jgi:hypothetical protein
MPANAQLSMTSKDDLVILVHGTYAADDSDSGAGWWQNGSQTWLRLRGQLPRGVRMPEQGEVFHWSGLHEWQPPPGAVVHLV